MRARPAAWTLTWMLFAVPAAAQKPAPEPQIADLQSLGVWLHEYKAGAIRLVHEGKTDTAALERLDATMAAVAKVDSLPAAKLLFEAAGVEPRSDKANTTAEQLDLQRETLPWKVQALACHHLRSLHAPAVLPWLLGMLQTKGLRAADKNQDQHNAATVLRVLAGHPSLEAKLELLHACRALPTELRVQAILAMGKDAALDTAPTLLELLRDVEPNVRLAAADALGNALQAHVDETQGKKPEGDVLATRDQAIARLQEVLVKDTVWQVRSAAASALATLRCKPAIPALIEGLRAELGRKKDPWAMDVRLHKLLEGLTAQKVVRGDIRLWDEFWKREGPTFHVAAKPAPGQEPPKSGKYARFFDLEIESDRVLFVLDFSGSMAEPVQLAATGGTAAGKAAAKESTKAALVVAELKKLLLSLPDGALVNLVVFNDQVRTWREENGRPALVKLDDAARDDLVGRFLDTLHPDGPTNLYGALDKALQFGGRGLYDKWYGAAFDTLYVISDGAPTVGDVVDKDEIRRRVRECNALRKIAIHCITFGDKNDTDFLRQLAEENGGRHIHIQ